MEDQDTRSAQAKNEGVCHTDAECELMFAELPEEVKAPALLCLRTELAPIRTKIMDAFHAHPEAWWVGYHFSWGMAVRNLLRQKGFGEAYFKVHNLDDIYVPLVEEALELKKPAA